VDSHQAEYFGVSVAGCGAMIMPSWTTEKGAIPQAEKAFQRPSSILASVQKQLPIFAGSLWNQFTAKRIQIRKR
jgi:hypothetical protein